MRALMQTERSGCTVTRSPMSDSSARCPSKLSVSTLERRVSRRR